MVVLWPLLAALFDVRTWRKTQVVRVEAHRAAEHGPLNVLATGTVALCHSRPETPAWILLYRTVLELNPLQVFHIYQVRFQIEFLFRDTKLHLGLTHCQDRSQPRLYYHFYAVMPALAQIRLVLRYLKQAGLSRFCLTDLTL